MKKFRISARYLFLTYKYSEESLKTKEQLITLLTEKLKPKWILVSYEESDADHPYKHFHAVVYSETKFNIVTQDFLDLNEIHGNYEKVRDPINSILYVIKKGNFLIEGNLNLLKSIEKSRITKAEKILCLSLLKGKTILELVHESEQKVLKEKTLDLESIAIIKEYHKTLKAISDKQTSILKETQSTEDFYMLSSIHNRIFEWLANHKDGTPKTVLLIIGKPGIGKTSAIDHMTKQSNLRLDHKDKAKEYDPNIHKFLILDDITLKHLNREFVIKLLDSGRELQQDVKGGMICFSKDIVRIWLSNKPLEYLLPCEPDEAIKRRLTELKMEPIFHKGFPYLKPMYTIQEFTELKTKYPQLVELYTYVNRGSLLLSLESLRRNLLSSKPKPSEP